MLSAFVLGIVLFSAQASKAAVESTEFEFKTFEEIQREAQAKIASELKVSPAKARQQRLLALTRNRSAKDRRASTSISPFKKNTSRSRGSALRRNGKFTPPSLRSFSNDRDKIYQSISRAELEEKRVQRNTSNLTNRYSDLNQGRRFSDGVRRSSFEFVPSKGQAWRK